MNDRKDQRVPWQPVVAEFVGTALLVLVGLSVVILMFGAGSPAFRLVPNEGSRRLIGERLSAHRDGAAAFG